MAQPGHTPLAYYGVPRYTTHVDGRSYGMLGPAPRSPRTVHRYPVAFDTPNPAANQPWIAGRDFQHIPHTSIPPLAGSSAPWNNGQYTYSYPQQQQQQQQTTERKREDAPLYLSPFITRLYPGNRFDFRNDFSAVLSAPTIFTPWHPKTAQADWPSAEEMRYEGSDRIATDRIHRRFLCMPRIRAGNSTVNWQQRQFVAFHPLDDFSYKVPNQVDIFLRNYSIPDIEPSDEEGVKAIGAELMGML